MALNVNRLIFSAPLCITLAGCAVVSLAVTMPWQLQLGAAFGISASKISGHHSAQYTSTHTQCALLTSFPPDLFNREACNWALQAQSFTSYGSDLRDQSDVWQTCRPHKEHKTVCNAVCLPTQTLQCVRKTAGAFVSHTFTKITNLSLCKT
jgi:hypothetical protein